MSQSIYSCKASVNVDYHEFLDKILGLYADAFPYFTLEFPDATSDHANDLIFVACVKWWTSTKHDIQNDSDTPHVTHFCVIALQDLRCNIIWSAILLVHGVVFFVIVLRCAKVDNFNSAIVVHIDHNVFWLQISVSNVLSMTISDGLEDLFAEFSSFLFVEDLSLTDFFEKFTTVTQLRYQNQI